MVSHALPESKNVEEVSITVQAFMLADLPHELIALLEKIVLHSSEFSQFKKLQHLLLKTAIQSDHSKVMDYIKRLDNYEGPVIAQDCISSGLYEEAFEIYKKHKMEAEALSVLLDELQDLSRGAEFVEKINSKELWTLLGNSYLNNSQIDLALDCYLKS